MSSRSDVVINNLTISFSIPWVSKCLVRNSDKVWVLEISGLGLSVPTRYIYCLKSLAHKCHHLFRSLTLYLSLSPIIPHYMYLLILLPSFVLQPFYSIKGCLTSVPCGCNCLPVLVIVYIACDKNTFNISHCPTLAHYVSLFV